jgi:large-conductance mechanosensitive channel
MESISNISNSITSKVKSGLKDYIGIFTKNNILGFAIAMMLANTVIEFSNVTIDSIVMPTIDPILKKNKSYNIQIRSINIDLSKFIKSLLKLFILTLFIFILFKYTSAISLSSSIGVTQTKSV